MYLLVSYKSLALYVHSAKFELPVIELIMDATCKYGICLPFAFFGFASHVEIGKWEGRSQRSCDLASLDLGA